MKFFAHRRLNPSSSWIYRMVSSKKKVSQMCWWWEGKKWGNLKHWEQRLRLYVVLSKPKLYKSLGNNYGHEKVMMCKIQLLFHFLVYILFFAVSENEASSRYASMLLCHDYTCNISYDTRIRPWRPWIQMKGPFDTLPTWDTYSITTGDVENA